MISRFVARSEKCRKYTFLVNKFLKHIDKDMLTCQLLKQHEKVIIFRYSRGDPTDLLDV